MQIRVANAARLHFDEHFVRARLRLLDVFNGQRRFELMQDGGFHRVSLNECEFVIRIPLILKKL
jgi:hypothetical protein